MVKGRFPERIHTLKLTPKEATLIQIIRAFNVDLHQLIEYVIRQHIKEE